MFDVNDAERNFLVFADLIHWVQNKIEETEKFAYLKFTKILIEILMN